MSLARPSSPWPGAALSEAHDAPEALQEVKMTASQELKPRPFFRILFFIVGLCFLYDGYRGIVSPTASFGSDFQYTALGGLGFFFCRHMTFGSNWWRYLPRWMMK